MQRGGHRQKRSLSLPCPIAKRQRDAIEDSRHPSSQVVRLGSQPRSLGELGTKAIEFRDYVGKLYLRTWGMLISKHPHPTTTMLLSSVKVGGEGVV